MKGRDFIITGLQSWDIPIGSNAIDIAREIAKNNRVLYVNSPLDQMTILRNKPTPETKQRLEVYRKQKEGLRRITDNLWVLDFPFSVWSVNGFPDGFIFDFFNKLNNKKIFGYVRKVAEELHFKDFIHFIDNDIYRSFYSKEYLKPAYSVYYRRDNLQPFAYWKKHVQRLEPLLIKKSDLVVCNSPQLANFARPFNPKSFDIGQGVDLSAYSTEQAFQIPDDVAPIPTPRIGYIGDINSLRLDPDLLCELAKSKPGYSFVMIGREDKVFASHELHSIKNVYFLGSIPKNMVPAYMSTLDVCLNPQAVNEITIGNYPRKVDEYLALGKPVIATKTDTMELFREHTYLCTNVQEYQDAVEHAVKDTNKEKIKQRILFAQSHSWENNVKNIYSQIQANKI
ncbi:MAG: glycosyltransferase family 1 protein [Bacteroidetes bacterium HGW-Bacteroidetes-11]|jgi:glycosyltransferase involved in cell wall biosynthesis|nr:MAG: glycosyltransferase family 1 protein [Bacteroidetes bacterium HGW-Bacteroidetes-11]